MKKDRNSGMRRGISGSAGYGLGASSSDMLDASELGPHVTVEIAKWFNNEVTGRHVSYFLCDKALLLITSGRAGGLLSGQAGMTGGPLGAVVGGHTDAKV